MHSTSKRQRTTGELTAAGILAHCAMAAEPQQQDLGLNRQTQIVATLGPASWSTQTLTEMIEAGVNVFRLNCSHRRAGVFEKVTLQFSQIYV